MRKRIISFVFAIISALYILPIFIVLINSVKNKTAISAEPFKLPNAETFNNFENFINGITFGNYPFFKSVLYSLLITVVSTLLILLCTFILISILCPNLSNFPSL